MKYQQPHRALNTSKIRSAAYDENRQTLEIAFQDGMLRSYRSLPADVARRFFTAQNPATFWEDRIAEEYPMTQVRMEKLPPLMESDPVADAARLLGVAINQVQRVIVGQEHMAQQLMVALLAKGHCLLEGVPGVA